MISVPDNEYGVSQTIGVILLVGLTVSLVTLSIVIVFNISTNVSENADATIQLKEIDDSVQATIIRKKNVDKIRIKGPNGATSEVNKVSNSVKIADGNGVYTVIAVLQDGTKEVLKSESFSAKLIKSGTVFYNPPVEGILVESYNESGDIIDYDITDPIGKYAVEGGDYIEVNNYTAEVNSNGNINLNTVSENLNVNLTDIVFDKGTGDSSNPYKIKTASGLQVMETSLNSDYEIINDINASVTSKWNNGKGFDPVGNPSNPFKGNIDGNGHRIDDLYINRPEEDDVGLLGKFSSESIAKNIILVHTDVTGGFSVGGLVGDNNGGTVKKSSSKGNITGKYNSVGGLIGANNGLVTKSYSKGEIKGDGLIGGLVGDNNRGTISKSYAIGNVTGGNFTGGLSGSNTGTVKESYASSKINGDNYVGGLIGYNNNDVINSYWDKEVSIESSSGGMGLKTNEMKGTSASSNMVFFDFYNTWDTVSNDYPRLKWQS